MTLTDTQRRILALLNDPSTNGRPTTRAIATAVGISYASVDVHLLRLESKGLIKAKRPTELYQLLRDFGIFLAARSWSETDKVMVLSLRERIASAVGDW